MILWNNFNFWTAVGHLGIGVLVGLTIGIIAREARRYALANSVADNRLCPACGSRALRRIRRSPAQRIIGAFTGRWAYGCRRCGWSSPRRRGTVRPRPLTLAARTAAPTPQPAAIKREPAATKEREAEKSVTSNDVAAVKAAVYGYLAMLNGGDVTSRAKCYLSESTGFGFDGGLLASAGFDPRAVALDAGQSYDLRCRDLRIYIHKDTAIATAYLVGSVSRPDGAVAAVTGRSSWVHLRQNGEWKLAHTHLSPLNPNSLSSPAPRRVEPRKRDLVVLPD